MKVLFFIKNTNSCSTHMGIIKLCRNEMTFISTKRRIWFPGLPSELKYKLQVNIENKNENKNDPFTVCFIQTKMSQSFL